jgi:hypothetical protein
MALAAGLRQIDAGNLVDVDDRTIRRWLDIHEFQHLIATYRAHNTAELGRRLDALQLDAATTLHDLMREHQPANVRLGAARTIIERAARLREETELRQ